MPYYRGVGTNSKVVGDLILSISNVDALPSKKAGIDGPVARSEHGQGGTEGSQQDIAPRIMGMREANATRYSQESGSPDCVFDASLVPETQNIR
jgi:hypothetical protein